MVFFFFLLCCITERNGSKRRQGKKHCMAWGIYIPTGVGHPRGLFSCFVLFVTNTMYDGFFHVLYSTVVQYDVCLYRETRVPGSNAGPASRYCRLDISILFLRLRLVVLAACSTCFCASKRGEGEGEGEG